MRLFCKVEWTALMWAADKGHAEIVQLLLNAGASVNTINKDVSDCMCHFLFSIFN